MKIFTTITLLLCTVSGVALADDPAGDAAKMDAWIKASTPGAEHKQLQQYVGNWNHIVKWWVKPGAEPAVSKGKTEVTSILGGRFIQQHATGNSMGKPFEGWGVTGYDNIKKVYSSYWIDNMGTGAMIGTGSFDAAENAVVDKGSFSCPTSPTGTRDYRAVWTTPKNRSYVYKMYINNDQGKKELMMEITYTKA